MVASEYVQPPIWADLSADFAAMSAHKCQSGAAKSRRTATDDLARMVYKKVKALHLLLPSLADECPEWKWYEEG